MVESIPPERNAPSGTSDSRRRQAGSVQAPHRRAAPEHTARGRVEQRLLPRTIARHQQAMTSPVPQRKGKHAVESLDDRVAPRLVAANDRLGIAARAENLPG